MAKNETVFFTKEAKLTRKLISSGSTQDIVTAGADGTKVLNLKISDNSAIGNGTLKYFDGTTEFTIKNLGAVTPDDDLMQYLPYAIDKNGNKYMNIENGSAIRLRCFSLTIETISYSENF